MINIFESTLAYLGKYIADKSGLPKNQIVYCDKESLFYYLKKEELPMVLPAISYNMTDINDPQMRRPMNRINGGYSEDFNTMNKVTLIPLVMTINIALLADNLKDNFFLSKIYYKFMKEREFKVEIRSDENFVDSNEIEGAFNCVLNNHSSLSTPPARGEEGRDFDRGRFYVLEGSFEINTFAAFSENAVIVRSFHLRNEWGEIKVIGG